MKAAQHSEAEDCIKLLVQAGAGVNTIDNEGNTALIHAAKRGYNECIKTLFEAGADLNVSNVRGYTGLMEAAERGFLECTQELVQSGADVNKEHSKALYVAGQIGDNKTIDILLKAGADVKDSGHISGACNDCSCEDGESYVVRDVNTDRSQCERNRRGGTQCGNNRDQLRQC